MQSAQNPIIWKRLRFPKCEMWKCGNIVVRREHESHGLWCVVYYGNQSVHVWKTARAAKLAAESTSRPIVIESHIKSEGYVEVFPFADRSSDLGRSPVASPVVVGQGGILLDLPMNRLPVPPSAISGDCNCSNTDHCGRLVKSQLRGNQ
jgi:hypothetical protein